MQEAVFHAVPVLGLPVYFDQYSNVEKVVAQGWGEMIEWEQLSEQLLNDNVMKLLSNSR